MLPFDRSDINSYALHSDGHTILVSTSEVTYALDTSKLSTNTVRAHESGLSFIPKTKTPLPWTPEMLSPSMLYRTWGRICGTTRRVVAAIHLPRPNFLLFGGGI
jgi:hypothetical protein